MEILINYWAVLASAVASMVIGTIWYGTLFKESWTSMVGLDPNRKPKGMAGTMLIALISSFISACVLSRLISISGGYLGDAGVSLGIMTGIWVWLGFAAPISLGVVLWEMKPWKLWVINASYFLVSFVVQGIILASWL